MYLDLVPIFLECKKYSSTFWMNLLHHCFLKSQNILSQKDSLEMIFYSFEEKIVAEDQGLLALPTLSNHARISAASYLQEFITQNCAYACFSICIL